MEGEEKKEETLPPASEKVEEPSHEKLASVEEPEPTSSSEIPVPSETPTVTAEEENNQSPALPKVEEENRKKLEDPEDNPHDEEPTANKEETHPKKEEVKVKKEETTSNKTDDESIKKEEITNAKGKASSTNSGSPKSITSADGLDAEDIIKNADSPGPKVPPLKIVIPSAETEQGNNRNGKNTSRHHPYVVVSNEETSTSTTTVTTTPSSPSIQCATVKEEPQSPSSVAISSANEDQKVQQRVLRSTHSSKGPILNNCGTGNTSGSNSTATSNNSSPAAPELSPQTDTPISKEDVKPVKVESTPNKMNKMSENAGRMKPDTVSVKVKTETEDEPVVKTNNNETRNMSFVHKEETNTVDLHPRKRKLKTKPEPTHTEVENVASFASAPHPHEVPVTNCYQMFMDIRRQIDVKRKGLFPIQPKPPQGFKDYLMNRCTYTLAGNSAPRLKRRNNDPPEGVPEEMRDLYLEQEAERYSLRMQHIVEKEKLVLSVEQEILRVHGRAARALANQALPFSACTILKDEEVYNVITPEQEEKDRNARSRYNGRLFISWLQDVDDKWEKIKEEMLARHHKEAESLNAIQKFKWDLRMRSLGLWKRKKLASVEENHVPMISVSDDFDLLPE